MPPEPVVELELAEADGAADVLEVLVALVVDATEVVLIEVVVGATELVLELVVDVELVELVELVVGSWVEVGSGGGDEVVVLLLELVVVGSSQVVVGSGFFVVVGSGSGCLVVVGSGFLVVVGAGSSPSKVQSIWKTPSSVLANSLNKPSDKSRSPQLQVGHASMIFAPTHLPLAQIVIGLKQFGAG